MAVDLDRSCSYLCVMYRILTIIALLTLPAAGWSAQAGEASPARPAEYMIYQYPDVSLVVKIDAPETEFESQIYGPEDALIKSSELPFGRIGPLYQYIGAVDTPRQLMIKVSPGRSVERSRINMELIQLPDRDRNSAALAQAYRLLSYGTEAVHSSDSTTWAMKTYTLRNAARAFAGLGWEEMRLWSEFYAAHLVLHKLNDVVLTLELAREIQDAARIAGFEMIELVARILESDALIAAGGSGSDKIAAARLDQAHAVLDRVVIMASQQGLKSEQARALFNDGLVYERQGQLDAAVRQFQRALDVSVTTEDTELVNEIRGTAASAYETLGRTAGAIEMLEDIGDDLQSDAAQEVTHNLSERGRLLNSTYRYEEAVQELTRALNVQKPNPGLTSWGPTGLALAWSYYSLGDMEQAVSLILESIPRTPQAGNTDALIQAYGSLAHFYRDQGDYGQMVFYREKQGAMIASDLRRAEFLFDSAMDAWRRDGRSSVRAGELLSQARQQAIRNGQTVQAHRAGLHLCLLRMGMSGSGACANPDIRQHRDALRRSGLPKLALEAEFLMAKIQRREGQSGIALVTLENLIDEIRFYRQTLPGVLGAWYWQTKAELFQEFMAITLEQSGSTSQKPVDGTRAVLALDRIRLIEADERSTAGGIVDQRQDESLRALLAQREAASGSEAESLARQAGGELQALRNVFEPAVSPLNPASLEKLLAGLSSNESLLTYYFSESADYALIGNRQSMSLLMLSGATTVAARLGEIRDNVSRSSTPVISELDFMGRVLVKPVLGMLTRKLYLLPAGPLNGFPFNALRVDGRFLAETHDVVNLMNLSSVAGNRAVLKQGYADRVFLAGSPQSSRELFSYDVQASPEITSMTDRFVGPGLHIIQGVALNREEFRDDRFTEAGLIHLAIPGTIDLAFPDRSGLLMSQTGNDPAIRNLSPLDIRGLDFKAVLAVLSQTTTVGANRSDFDSRMGFVSDFLDGGVENVLVSFWFDESSGSVDFLRKFYAELGATGDIAEALSITRNARLKSGDEANFRSWAGFQLFIR